MIHDLADMEGATAYFAPSEKRIAYAASLGWRVTKEIYEHV